MKYPVRRNLVFIKLQGLFHFFGMNRNRFAAEAVGIYVQGAFYAVSICQVKSPEHVPEIIRRTEYRECSAGSQARHQDSYRQPYP